MKADSLGSLTTRSNLHSSSAEWCDCEQRIGVDAKISRPGLFESTIPILATGTDEIQNKLEYLVSPYTSGLFL